MQEKLGIKAQIYPNHKDISFSCSNYYALIKVWHGYKLFRVIKVEIDCITQQRIIKIVTKDNFMAPSGHSTTSIIIIPII